VGDLSELHEKSKQYTKFNTMKEILHNGDNLEFMKSLESESIDLIYSDILYGTGRKFLDYQDIKADRKIIENFYIPRITEMHRILKPTAAIYLQMDTRINHYVRLILEDIFGAKNFRNEIAYKKRACPNNTKTGYFPKNKDVILFFTKSQNYNFNTVYLPLSEEAKKKYSKKDNQGKKYCLMGILKENYNKNRTLILNNKEYNGAYAWTQKTLDSRIQAGYVVEENSLGQLAYRMYLDNSKGVPVSDFWEDLINEDTNSLYETQKSIELMARIIKSSSNEGDVCADFFCGSGTFGVAAKKLNRNIMLCDINPKAMQISKSRLAAESNLFNS